MATPVRCVFVMLVLLTLDRSAEAMVQFIRNVDQHSRESWCAPLVNHGTHSTVEVQIGTPSQKFDLLADTGSNFLVVSSCVCLESGSCDHRSKCFQGTNKSSTFLLDNRDGQGPPMTVLTFGSGQIQVAYASDIVRVDAVTANMDDALMLMVDHRLQIQGPFEGLLGLGLPMAEEVEMKPVKGFLEKAAIQQFSICLNDQDGGVLRMNTTMNPNSLGSIGKSHWGLGFEGISVGSSSSPVQFCSKEEIVGDRQETPCGAIPDSGTTLMMGPPSQLIELFRSICNEWPRCNSLASKKKADRSEVFQALLMRCQDWLVQGEGLGELPSLYFHVSGFGGKQQVLEIPPTLYVVQLVGAHYQSFAKQAPRTLGTMPHAHLDKVDAICVPAFAEMEFKTEVNGPVWILGTPIFYQYQVSYDLGAKPPAVAFSEAPCGSCPENSFFRSRRTRRTRRNGWSPMKLNGPPRLPSFSMNQSRVM